MLGKSNSHIKMFMKEKSENYVGYFRYLRDNFNFSFGVKELIRSQFPTILSFNNASIDLRKDKSTSSRKKEDFEVLEDLILIDELMEDEEGELLELNKNKNIAEGEIPKPKGITPIKIDKKKTYILIYHTHGTESYLPIKDDNYHTTDKEIGRASCRERVEKTERDEKAQQTT